MIRWSSFKEKRLTFNVCFWNSNKNNTIAHLFKCKIIRLAKASLLPKAHGFAPKTFCESITYDTLNTLNIARLIKQRFYCWLSNHHSNILRCIKPLQLIFNFHLCNFSYRNHALLGPLGDIWKMIFANDVTIPRIYPLLPALQ